MTSVQRPPAGLGCLGTIVGAVLLVAIAVLVVFVGFVAVAVVAGLVVVGLVAWAVDRVLLALSPRRRQRREARNRAVAWRFGTIQRGDVIDATATTDEPRSTRPDRRELGPEDERGQD